MKKGYKFERVACPDCGEEIPFNWLIRHRNAEHPVEAEPDFFEYERLPGCQYPVVSPVPPHTTSDCDAAAVAVGWWNRGYNGVSEPQCLCRVHLQQCKGDASFDYDDYLPTCQYPVADPSSPSREADCGAAAVAVGWWRLDGEGNPVDPWCLCEEHLRQVLEAEKRFPSSLVYEESGG